MNNMNAPNEHIVEEFARHFIYGILELKHSCKNKGDFALYMNMNYSFYLPTAMESDIWNFINSCDVKKVFEINSIHIKYLTFVSQSITPSLTKAINLTMRLGILNVLKTVVIRPIYKKGPKKTY